MNGSVGSLNLMYTHEYLLSQPLKLLSHGALRLSIWQLRDRKAFHFFPRLRLFGAAHVDVNTCAIQSFPRRLGNTIFFDFLHRLKEENL